MTNWPPSTGHNCFSHSLSYHWCESTLSVKSKRARLQEAQMRVIVFNTLVCPHWIPNNTYWRCSKPQFLWRCLHWQALPMPSHRAPPALDQNHLRHTIIPCWVAACTCMKWTNKCFFTKPNAASQIRLCSFWNKKLGYTIRMVESPALFSPADKHLNKNK